MLKHDQIEEMAAKVRVTPEELAAAIAALEARKQGSSGTIAIGEAVEELSLDNTPNDILREIDAQRERRTRNQRKRRRGLFGLAAALVAIGSAGVVLRPHTQTPRPSISTVVTSQASSLSDVRDGQQVYVDTHGLKQIIEGTPASQVQVYAGNEGIRWGLIKHAGKTYLQAYTLRATEKALTTKPIVIVNSEDHDGPVLVGFNDNGTLYETVKVTLPIRDFQCQDSEQTPQHAQLTVRDVHTDSHLWDGFTDRFAP